MHAVTFMTLQNMLSKRNQAQNHILYGSIYMTYRE